MQNSFNDRAMFSGFLLGILTGSMWGLFRGPRIRLNLNRTRDQIASTAQSVRNSLTPTDPILLSIAEGKQAARHRVEQGTSL